MNMEDFINGYPGTESGMKREFAKAMGAGKAELFFEKILDNFLNEDDIRFIGETGANCIRIPLSYTQRGSYHPQNAYNSAGS